MESLRNKNHRPTHPGEILREDVLPAIRMTLTEFARRLGVSRRTVSQIVNERRPVTPDMAVRLARLIGSTPSFWLRLQQAVDIWDMEHNYANKYARIRRLKVG